MANDRTSINLDSTFEIVNINDLMKEIKRLDKLIEDATRYKADKELIEEVRVLKLNYEREYEERMQSYYNKLLKEEMEGD